MKIVSYSVIFFALMVTVITGCKREASTGSERDISFGAKGKPPIAPSSSCGYLIDLESNFENGQTTFVWTITNPNPGNGKNGTIQNVSHWDFVAEACENPDNNLVNNWDHIAAVAYRYGTDGPWQYLYTADPNDMYPAPPVPGPDPSITGCSSANMFKFDQGTSGGTPTQYQIILDGNWTEGTTTAWFKSGLNTGCCSQIIDGIGCLQEFDCSFSQGYWFAKPGITWEGQTLTIGGHTYTQEEGKSIWSCSNAGGLDDSKKAFTQGAAILLSIQLDGATIPQSVLDDVAIIEVYLASLSKLTTYNCDLPTGGTAGTAAAAAAGRIGNWISANHCGSN